MARVVSVCYNKAQKEDVLYNSGREGLNARKNNSYFTI